MAYNLGNKTFKYKSHAESHARSILYSGQVESDLFGDDFDYMMDYFEEFHCEWVLKKGKGIKSIRRSKEPIYGKYRAFWIYRIDDTDTDISYLLKNIQRKDYYREFSQAMRKVVQPQIDHFRNKCFAQKKVWVCPLTGKDITRGNCHVDHVHPSFKELIDSFIKEYDIKLEPKLFPVEKDGQVLYDINDQGIKNNFSSYHFDNARLMLVSKEGNLSKR